MKSNVTVPVIIEDLVSKIKDTNTHYEQRQHYAQTLRNIISYSQNALKEYEDEVKSKRKR